MNLLWRLSLRNLFRNRRRSLTTGIAITSGFIGLSLLGGYLLRVQRGLLVNTVYMNMHGHLQIHKLHSMDQFSLSPKKYVITPELNAQIEQTLQKYKNKIEFQGKFLTGSGLLVSESISHPFVARGAEQEVISKASAHPILISDGWLSNVKSLLNHDFQKAETISITPRIAQILGRPTDLKNLTEEQKGIQLITRSFMNDLNAVSAELGPLHTTGIALAEDTSVRMPLKLLQDLLATDGYQYLTLFLKDATNAFDLKQALMSDFQLLNAPLEVFHFTEGDIGEFYVGTMNFLYVITVFFVFLICGIVTLSIINSLTLGLLERVKEIGTLKAIGFSQRTITGLFVRETIWLCAFSMAIGVIIAQIIIQSILKANIQFSPPATEGEVQSLLANDFRVYLILILLIGFVAVFTTYFVSKAKLKSTAIELLSESGV